MAGFTRTAAPLVLVGLLGACGTFPENPELDRFDERTGYRFELLEPGPRNTDSLFVIVTLSGGGTRAAALGYGVLDALRRTRITWRGEEKTLLDEVDIVSSVSGGSFTAAYYALHREKLFDGRFDEVFLERDVQSELLGELFVPANWLKLAGRSYGRSDLAAEYYHERIFDRATYRALIEDGRRPFFVINATDMSLGARFPFIQDQFDLICSDLSAIPVARAVAASSAFPGLLAPLTFRNRAGGCGFEDYEWVRRAEADRRRNAGRAILADQRRSYYDPPPGAGPRDFVHLVDGGVADNIGLRGPLYAIASTDPTYSILRKINEELVDKVVVVVVNAATDPYTDWDRSAAVPDAKAVIQAAATAPLDNYSADTVALLEAKVGEFNQSYDSLVACDAALAARCPGSSLHPEQLHPVDLYVVEVAFDFVADAADRARYKNIGTTFSLPAETVGALKRVGCTLLRDDPELERLLAGRGRTRERVSGTAPACPGE